MSLGLSPLVFAAAALSATAPVPDGEPAAIDRDHPQVVFQLRASAVGADVARLVSDRLAPAWRPARLKALFAERADAASPLERVYVSDLPAGMTAERAAALLARDPAVEYAQVDHVHETHAPPGDPFFHSSGSWGQVYEDQWGLRRINGGLAMELARGSGTIIAVVDSGVDYTHPELAGHIWINPEEQDGGGGPGNGFPDDEIGWDFVSNDNDPMDAFGHGSHMAGVAAAADDFRGMVGAAPRALIMAVRAVNGAGAANSSTLAQGVVYAADNGADVILLASGCIARCPSDPVLENAIRHAFDERALVVVSAGNRGDDVAFYSPQNMTNPKPIVVAGTNELDQRASNSNTGNLVDLAAPGGGTNTPPPSVQPTLNILSVASASCSPLVCNPAFIVTEGPTRYLRRSGTSLSAAFVAGVAAQVVSEDPRLEWDGVRARLLGNARDLGAKGWDPTFGWGRLDALDSVGDLRRYAIARIAVPASGQTVSGVVRIAGTAAARGLERFEVSVGQGASPASWSTAGVIPVEEPTAFGELAHWDTTGLPGGTWTIRLVVEDDVLGVRESRRTVTVAPTVPQPLLVVDVQSERGGAGTVEASPTGDFCAGTAYATKTCSYPLVPGQAVTLTPIADALSHFTGWTGACSGTGACTVAVSSVKYARATFRGPYHLGVEVERGHNGQGGAQIVPPDAACDAGETCRFTYRQGTPVTVFAFEGGPLDSWAWLEGPCSGTSTQLVMDQDHLCKAVSFQLDITNPVSISAGLDLRAPLGTPVLLQGYAFSQAQPLTYTWTDLTNNAFVSDELQPSVTLGYGVHELLFRATDANGEANEDIVLVVVHDP